MKFKRTYSGGTLADQLRMYLDDLKNPELLRYKFLNQLRETESVNGQRRFVLTGAVARTT